MDAGGRWPAEGDWKWVAAGTGSKAAEEKQIELLGKLPRM